MNPRRRDLVSTRRPRQELGIPCRLLGPLTVLVCVAAWVPGLVAPAEGAEAKAAAPAGASLGEAQALLAGGRYQEAATVAARVIEANSTGAESNRARSLICQARAEGRLSPAQAPMPLVHPSVLPRSAQPLPESSPGTGFEPSDSMPPMRLKGLITKPERLFGLPPTYCEAERKARVQGVTILEAIIERDGCLSGLKVLKPLTPCLDDAALRSAMTWVFAPASLHGVPVRVYYTLTINFQVQKAPRPSAVPGEPPS